VFFIFIKLNGEGASPLHIPHSLEKFLFNKESDNECEFKGGCPVNGIALELPMQRTGTFNLLYCVFLTMEMNGMNERGYPYL